MAFRHSTYQPPQRIYTAPLEESQLPSPPTQTQPLEESTEWILFSPTAPSTTDRTYTTSTTARTRTAGHSRVSDFGSLDTAARSYDEASSHRTQTEQDEEDGELDSLDSHLHEFRTEPSVYRGETERESQERSSTQGVFPTHDGLGSFRVDQTAMGDEVQQHLYAFERFNPRRLSVKRRREDGLEANIFEEETERAAEAERTRRIEAWRMEQSRLLVDEIQRETRRRKQSMSMGSERRASILSLQREAEDVATLSNVEGSVQEEEPEENESFWNRITKRVIRDLMGIDDDLLSIIFGETLPAELDDDLSSTPQQHSHLNAVVPSREYDESSWEYRLLSRIARELGILVNQIADHPGAFSTYLQTQTEPLPYAGLPVIPETRDPTQIGVLEQSVLEQSARTETINDFRPTLQTQPLPIAIPQSSISLAPPSPLGEADATPRPSHPIITRDEWERDLDIKMVFKYLRSRFTSLSPALPTPHGLANFKSGGTSHLATASTADTAARAARVRQHHPLVTRERPSSRQRTWRVSVPSTGAGVGKESVPQMLRRGSSSCASEIRSVRSGNGVVGGAGYRRNSGSSRHYWDFGHGTGSVGSGSMIASTGGMGSWGEV